MLPSNKSELFWPLLSTVYAHHLHLHSLPTRCLDSILLKVHITRPSCIHPSIALTWGEESPVPQPFKQKGSDEPPISTYPNLTSSMDSFPQTLHFSHQCHWNTPTPWTGTHTTAFNIKCLLHLIHTIKRKNHAHHNHFSFAAIMHSTRFKNSPTASSISFNSSIKHWPSLTLGHSLARSGLVQMQLPLQFFTCLKEYSPPFKF